MLITPKINPYNYSFPSIVEEIKNSPQDKDFIKFIKQFGFKIQKVQTTHPSHPRRILRVFFLNAKYGLVAKFSNRHNDIPEFSYLMPSFGFDFCGRFLTLQPFGDDIDRKTREYLANSYCVELAGFDCAPDNFVTFKGLPALIDW